MTIPIVNDGGLEVPTDVIVAQLRQEDPLEVEVNIPVVYATKHPLVEAQFYWYKNFDEQQFARIKTTKDATEEIQKAVGVNALAKSSQPTLTVTSKREWRGAEVEVKRAFALVKRELLLDVRKASLKGGMAIEVREEQDEQLATVPIPEKGISVEGARAERDKVGEDLAVSLVTMRNGFGIKSLRDRKGEVERILLP